MSSQLLSPLLGLICTGIAGEDSRVTRLTVGLVLMLALCAPASELRLADVSQILAQSRTEAEQAVSGVEVRSRDLLARIISERTEAYILDKAEALEVSLDVKVSVSEEGIPNAVTLTGPCSPYARRILSAAIASDLGIAKEHQTWIG